MIYNSALPPVVFVEALLNSFPGEPTISSLIGLSLATGHPLVPNISRFGPQLMLLNLQPAHG